MITYFRMPLPSHGTGPPTPGHVAMSLPAVTTLSAAPARRRHAVTCRRHHQPRRPTGPAEALSSMRAWRASRRRQAGGQGALTGPPARGGRRRNRSLTQRPGAVRAIHSGLLMTVRSSEERTGTRTAAARAGRPRWRTTASCAVEALRRTRRITHRLTGSPASRITGEKMTISGHRARDMTAWLTGLGRLIWPGEACTEDSLARFWQR